MTSGVEPVKQSNTAARVVAAISIGFPVFFLVYNAIYDIQEMSDVLFTIAAFGSFGLVGAIILRTDSRHRIGWLFAAIMLVGVVGGISAIAVETWPMSALALVTNAPTWWPVMALILVFLPLWFPTGRPPTPRWRWVGWLAAIGLVGVVAQDLFEKRPCIEWYYPEYAANICLGRVTNPIGIEGVVAAEQSALGGIFFGLMAVAFLGALASLIVRFRRSRGIERQQLKWFTFAAGLLVAWAVFADYVFIDILGNQDVLFGDAFAGLIFGLLLLAVPVSVGVAITRYRLYEIDRIINRTLVYAVVVVVLAVVFVLGAVWIPTLVPGDSNLAVAATTLAVFFLFQPLRRRVQSFVDRRFYRSRYDAQQVADQLGYRLRDEVDPEVVASDWLAAVNQTMRPATIGVWMRDTGSAE